jgi:uncharacterized membrane protein
MSARHRIALTLVGVLCLLSLGALAVYAAAKADFSIAVSPSSQTVNQGQATTYTVTVTRVNGFSDPVTLSTSGLPTGASASWKLANGTSSNVVPTNQNSATLTIQTAASTPTGTFKPVVTATGGKITQTTTLTLVVQQVAQPNFTLSTAPASQTISQGDDTSYSVAIARSGGFGGAINLSVAGLPKGATASFTPGGSVSGSSATLQVQTAGNSQTDTYTLTITGTGTIGSSSVSRTAAVTLVVQKSKGFQITGNLGAQLFPGVKRPLNLSLTNPESFDIKVSSISVAVEEATGRAGCSGTQNFKVTQIPAGRYPITVSGGQTRSLSQLGIADADKPQVEMLNRPWNQDVCKGASITLDYSGSAGK